MNSRKSAFLASVLVCLCLLGPLVSTAMANIIFGEGDVHTTSPPAPTILGQVNLASTDLAGQIYNNTITSTDPTQVNTVRVVGAIRMATYTAGGFSFNTTYDTLNMSLVFAIEGTSTPQGGGVQLFEAKSGRFGLFTYTGGFGLGTPTSWGATTGSIAGGDLALATPIAVWDLVPPDNMIDLAPGSGTFNFASSQVNNVLVDTVNPQTPASQGIFIAGETTTFADPMKSGNDYFTMTAIPPAFGGFPPNYREVAGLSLSERLTLSPQTLSAISGGANTDGFEVLNVIAKNLGGLLPLDAFDRSFATDYVVNSGNPLHFSPVTSTQAGSDVIFVGGVTLGFGVQEIPEPGTVAIFALILGGAGLVGAFRRRRARAVSQD